MEARDIKRYLADLGAALKNRGVKKPLRMMLIGGAYMLLLENAPRSTEDIDIFWLEEDAFERMREVVSACMLDVARKHMLPPNWFNFLTQVILMQDIYIPDGTLWNRFGPLYIYIPPREYILALKMTAGRPKDLDRLRHTPSENPLFKRSSKHRNCSIRTFSPKRKKNTVNRLRSRLAYFFRGARDEAMKKRGNAHDTQHV